MVTSFSSWKDKEFSAWPENSRLGFLCRGCGSFTDGVTTTCGQYSVFYVKEIEPNMQCVFTTFRLRSLQMVEYLISCENVGRFVFFRYSHGLM